MTPADLLALLGVTGVIWWRRLGLGFQHAVARDVPQVLDLSPVWINERASQEHQCMIADTL